MIIGIVGSMGAGKDTIADYLTTIHNFRRESFASSLKDSVSAIFGWDRTLLDGRTKTARDWREQPDNWWATRLSIPQLTPRWVLQNFATDLCRNHFHQDIWIASLEHRLSKSEDNIVITDCRFPNEFDSIKRMGGKIIRVSRGPAPAWHSHVSAALSGDSTSKSILNQYGVHESEWAWYGLVCDVIIENNGTIDDLYTNLNMFINPELDPPASTISLPDVVSVDSWRTLF